MAALSADATPSVILFNALLEKDLREDSGKIEQLPKHSLVIVQSLLVGGVVRHTSTLKIVVEEFARRLQTPYPVISDLFLEDSAHAFSSEIRRHRGEFPTQMGQTPRVDCCVCKMHILFDTVRVRSKCKDGCDGQQTFLLRQPSVKYMNDPQSTYQKKSSKHFNIVIDPHASGMRSTMFKTSQNHTFAKEDENVCDRTFADNFRGVKNVK